MKENKISIEITADGWKTDVTINGKTYSERHITGTGITTPSTHPRRR